MSQIDGNFFRSVPGEFPIMAVQADKVVVGVPQDNPDAVALVLGNNNNYYMLSCAPDRARKIAACLLNKADQIEGIS